MSVQIGGPAAAGRAHQELFAYWQSARPPGRLPRRRDIDPAGFKRLLPWVSLIDVMPAPADYRVRLAGTALYGLFGREITGRRLGEIYPQAAAENWRRELGGLVERRRPAVGYHKLAWRGGANMTVLWLRLPLISESGEVEMILGYDAPVGLAGDDLSEGRAA